MKKLIIFLVFTFITSLCLCQTKLVLNKKSNHSFNELKKQAYFVPNPDTIPLLSINIQQTNKKNGWNKDGKTCAGCPSYFYKITRSENIYKAEDENYYYYYYFYFCSNSFLTNGDITSTYLSNIDFFIDNILVNNVPYLLLEPKKIIYGAWVRTKNPNSIVSFKITNISVY